MGDRLGRLRSITRGDEGPRERGADAYEREAKEEKEVKARLERETTALNAATEAYGKQLSDHLNRREQISRLLAHIKANILYYMQAIWSHEPLDQRFFRLHEVRVPVLKGSLTYSLEEDANAVPGPPDWAVKPLKVVVKSSIGGEELQYESLEEAADLDILLGFKGNYMIFPLGSRSRLITAMMVPYLDPVLRLRDPDEAGNWTLTGLPQIMLCVWPKEHLSQKQSSRSDCRGWRRCISGRRRPRMRAREEIIVPTGSLFIEALPGRSTESWRTSSSCTGAWTLKKAQAEVRMAELEEHPGRGPAAGG